MANLATAAATPMGPGVLGALSTGSGVFSQIGGGVAQFAQGRRNAQMLNRIGKIEARETRREGRRFIGRQQVAAAASGIDPSTGSALDIQAEQAVENEVAALRARFARKAQAQAVKDDATSSLISGIGGGMSTFMESPTAKRLAAGEFKWQKDILAKKKGK